MWGAGGSVSVHAAKILRLGRETGIFPATSRKNKESSRNCRQQTAIKRTEHKEFLDGLSNAQAIRNVKEELASCGLEDLRKNSTYTRVTGLELCMV
jgi:hypothetical protein